MNFLNQMCADSTPNYFGFFDTTIAPPLLFYSYIPIFIIVLIFGFFIFLKNRKDLQSRLFLVITLSFALWIVAILFQWIAVYDSIVHFAWQVLAIPEIFIYIFSVYFVYVFLYKQDLPFWGKVSLSIVCAPIILLMPTTYNVASFDPVNCQGNLNYLWDYIYALEAVLIVVIGYLCVDRYRSLKGSTEKIQTLLLFFGVISFLGFFFATNFYGELIQAYEINLLGPIGMVIFISLLSYMIVKYKTFNIKLVGAQALILAILSLVSSQLFFIQTRTNVILTVITIFITSVIGYNLIRSVKREIEQRIRIEKLADELQVANQGQSSLIHFMNHQIKGRFGNIKNIFAELNEGDYGAMPAETVPLLKKGLDEANIGVNYVQGILNGASAEKGTISYNMTSMDFKLIVENTHNKQNEHAEKKGLEFHLDIKEGDYTVNGDALQLGETVRNLFDNSLNYTLTGSVNTILEVIGNKVRLTIKDTGVGLSDDDKSKLFKAGGRGADSLKVNVNATGYGLVFVKGVIEAHKGRVWAESNGRNQGSVFYLEIPKA